MTRAGFVALAGRPNVGKSTLTNAIVGQKVAIVSDRPQTTRRAIRGVATGPGWQLVLIDLPGVQRPRDALTERMAHRVTAELAGADAALIIVNGEEGIGPGDRFIAAALADAPGPVTIAFCDSVSTQTDASMRVSSGSPASRATSSMITPTACGSSWKVRRSTCSRISSPSSSSWSMSERCSAS